MHESDAGARDSGHSRARSPVSPESPGFSLSMDSRVQDEKDSLLPQQQASLLGNRQYPDFSPPSNSSFQGTMGYGIYGQLMPPINKQNLSTEPIGDTFNQSVYNTLQPGKTLGQLIDDAIYLGLAFNYSSPDACNQLVDHAVRWRNAFSQVIHADIHSQAINRELGSLMDSIISMGHRINPMMNDAFRQERSKNHNRLIVDFIQLGNDFDRLKNNAIFYPIDNTSSS